MRFQRLRRFMAFRPPFEAAFRQTFLRDPETLRVVDQYFDSGRAPATEQEQATRKRISLQLLFASLSQRVNSFLKSTGSMAARMRICGVICNIDQPVMPRITAANPIGGTPFI